MSCHGGVCSFCGGTGAKVKSVVTELQSQTKLRLVSYILVSLNVVSELQTLRLVFSTIFFFFYTAGFPQEDEKPLVLFGLLEVHGNWLCFW